MTTLERALREHGIRMEATYVGTESTDGWDHDAWSCTFRKSGEQGSLTFDYRMGLGLQGNEPKPAEVMDALLSDAVSYDGVASFEEWATEYGYDTDSRRAEGMYRACGETSRRLRTYLGTDVFDALVNAERD
jgi:hypothetical protein